MSQTENVALELSLIKGNLNLQATLLLLSWLKSSLSMSVLLLSLASGVLGHKGFTAFLKHGVAKHRFSKHWLGELRLFTW